MFAPVLAVIAQTGPFFSFRIHSSKKINTAPLLYKLRYFLQVKINHGLTLFPVEKGR